MSFDERLAQAEERPAFLQAIVDDGQLQEQEAPAYVLSLVVRGLHQIGVIHTLKFAKRPDAFSDKTSGREDCGQCLVRLDRFPASVSQDGHP